MPVIEKYDPGMFCWIELTTNDAAAAKSFYGSVFGWKINDIPIPDGSVYTMLQVDGHDLGALYENKEHPPAWNSYVNVTNVDEAAKKAQDLGANLIAPPFDVMDVGRMSVIADPAGASLCLWQAGKTIGATIRGDNNTLCWNELMTPDIEGAREFYKNLFGWNLKISPEYTEIDLGSTGIGGMMHLTPEMQGMPTAWTPYFCVADADATLEKIKSSGGKVYMGPHEIPNTGRFAVCGDPQGAMFNIIHPTSM
ncbi:MAG TPA: VOC family protein [Thermoanaerobaculia bacterium]|nr:VOC family protein [Thermoanaerobaculia bacterium]